MKVLAIDPGYERIGVAVLEKSPKAKESLLYSNCFKTSPKQDFYSRILAIGQEIERLITVYKPEALAIEKLYFSVNQKTALNVSEARGAIIYEAKRAGLSIKEFSPSEIKVAVTGYGKSDKRQVAEMLKRLIKIEAGKRHDDEYDAIAIGLTALASK